MNNRELLPPLFFLTKKLIRFCYTTIHNRNLSEACVYAFERSNRSQYCRPGKAVPEQRRMSAAQFFNPLHLPQYPNHRFTPELLKQSCTLDSHNCFINDPQNITTAHIYSSNKDKLKDLLKNPQGFKCSFWTRGETSLSSCPAVSALWRFNVTWVTWKG